MSQMQVLLSKKEGWIKEKDDIIDKKSDVIASQKHRIEILEEYLRLAKSNRLMSYVIVSKYVDGLPLHRLEKIIQRYGGSISRATLANWMIALSKQAQPLINLLREYQHAGSLIMADETHIQVLKEPNRSATSDRR